ncbi:MAG: ferrous iron transporter B [Magnetococcales bacterium]|nr:ferrous iron transporter B [Magnetococcales bacterium]
MMIMQHCHATTHEKVSLAEKAETWPIAIIGPSNAGKSVLFNSLTGEYTIVANYPQTTVEPTRRLIQTAQGPIELVDTPGIDSLTAHSRDEFATLKELLQDGLRGVLFCGHALNVKRSLVLLAQLLELELPVIACFNKSDQAASSGMVTDVHHLANLLSLPVLEISAEHDLGTNQVRESLETFRGNHGVWALPEVTIRYPAFVEETVEKLRKLFPLEQRPSKGVALLFMQDEDIAKEWFRERLASEVLIEAAHIVQDFQKRITSIRFRLALFQAREAWANRLAEKTVHQAAHVLPTLLQKVGQATRHPILGWPIFILILWLTFKGVGFGAVQLGSWLDGLIFTPAALAIGKLIPTPWVNEFFVGQFGLLTMGVANAMVTVVPILLIFFLIVHFLEDVGYLPSLSVLTNRALLPLGLSGKAVLPLVLGSGCNTTATMSSRILATRKERLLVSFLVALGVPCSVQMGVLFAILSTMPFTALLTVMGTVIGTTILCGLAMNRLLPGSIHGQEFILELPTFCLPHWRNILRKTWFRIKWFLIEAVPLFIAAAMAMFTLEKTGALTIIKSLLHPMVTGFLLLPDKITEVFILVLARREVGAIYFKQMVENGELGYQQIVTGLVVITLFIPCASNTMVMIKEFGARWAVATNLAIICIAILVGKLLSLSLALL